MRSFSNFGIISFHRQGVHRPLKVKLIVKDVKKYNRAVSMLWFAGAVLLEMIGVPLLFFEQNSPIFIFVVLGVIVLVIGMIIGYIKVENKYRT